MADNPDREPPPERIGVRVIQRYTNNNRLAFYLEKSTIRLTKKEKPLFFPGSAEVEFRGLVYKKIQDMTYPGNESRPPDSDYTVSVRRELEYIIRD